jgi:hypothetical protein
MGVQCAARYRGPDDDWQPAECGKDKRAAQRTHSFSRNQTNATLQPESEVVTHEREVDTGQAVCSDGLIGSMFFCGTHIRFLDVGRPESWVKSLALPAPHLEHGMRTKKLPLASKR